VRRYESRLWGVARAQGLSQPAAADVVQTVWLKLLDDPFQIHTPNALFYWLSTVARRLAIEESKRSKRFDGHDVPEVVDNDPTAEERAIIADAVAFLKEVFPDLDQKCRELLEAMHDERERSYTEIARRLGRPIGSLGPQRARCLAKLRVLYDRMYQGARARPAPGEEERGR
jgi:RNA polymerase sigma factor (sigma-70 family)